MCFLLSFRTSVFCAVRNLGEPRETSRFLRRNPRAFGSLPYQTARLHRQITGGNVLSMMLALSLVLAILPLLGVVWTVLEIKVTTVDGLFMILILLTLSGVFMLNAYWEMRDSGMIGKKKAATPAAKTPPTKAS